MQYIYSTKRNILWIQVMFYNSPGLISPIILPIKIILQKNFNSKSNGIKILMQTLVSYGYNILKDLSMLALSLYTVTSSAANKCSYLQLHGFCDSFEKTYCTVAYAQVVCRWKKLCCWDHSIPRLELMTCILLAWLMTEVKKEMEKEIVVWDENIFCWSDSMVPVWWVKQVSKTWKVWVQNSFEH